MAQYNSSLHFAVTSRAARIAIHFNEMALERSSCLVFAYNMLSRKQAGVKENVEYFSFCVRL